MDVITLKSLQFTAGHGYYEEERNTGNRFEVDITALGDFRGSAEEDNLEHTFNYEMAAGVASDVFEGPSRKLIEKLCHTIGERLFQKAGNVTKLCVSVRKIHPPLPVKTDYAEITMEWKR